MYAYDELDRTLINERVSEFRDQVKRRLSGELTEDEFKILRLQNGVYLQLHAYMFRVAIPYGTLSSKQLRRLAHVARRYDRGYGHFTTRQNIQFNWPALVDIPDILDALAGDIGSTQMPFDPFAKINDGNLGVDLLHRALDDGTLGVLGHPVGEGILLHLLDAERDTLTIRVHGQHHGLDRKSVV